MESVERIEAAMTNGLTREEEQQFLRWGFLLSNRAMRDRSQDLRIEPSAASDLLGVHCVALTITVGDGLKLPHVGHDHLVSQFLQLFVDPDRVNTSLHGDTCVRHIDELLLDGLRCSSEAASVDHFTVFVESAVMASDVTEVHHI